jgi:hypothetical protein
VERRRRIDRHRSADRRRGRLREARIRERPARADAGEQRRAVSGEAELALELVGELFDLGDHVVTAIVARREPVQVRGQIHVDHCGVLVCELARRAPQRRRIALHTGEQEHTRSSGGPSPDGRNSSTRPSRPASRSSREAPEQPARSSAATTRQTARTG